MKNKVVFTVNKNGSVNVKLDSFLFNEEFKKIKALYGIDDMNIDLFKADGLMFVLTNAVQGWITSFDGDAKNDYYLVMDYTRISEEKNGDTYSVYHVVDGTPVYEQEDKGEEIVTASEYYEEELQRDNKEDLVEASTDID